MPGFFVTHHRHSLDPKRRLTIPAEWREIVGDPPQVFVIPSVGARRYLNVFPARIMGPRLQNLQRVSMADEKARDCLRILGSRSELLRWDVQGRIRIREELLRHAGIRNEVLITGNFENIEIWAPEQFAKFERATGEADLAKIMRSMGI